MRTWQKFALAIVIVAVLGGGALVIVSAGSVVGRRTVRSTVGTVGAAVPTGTPSAEVIEAPPSEKGKPCLPESPAALARAAGATLDEYALARVVASEHGSAPQIVQIGVAHATRNYARAAGLSISALVLRSTGKGAGYFGAQWQGRYASTAVDPREGHLKIARDVLAGRVSDPTGGARQYDSPKAFGQQPGTTAAGADAVAARRLAAGNVKVLLAGVPESTIRFWRPA